jgi:1-acyl-sn-glycerol-3-phosphate acyltransferase
MRVVVGILSTTLVVSNVVLHCLPLFLIGLVRLLARGLGMIRAERRIARAMDRIVDSWIVVNRLIFGLLDLTRLDVTWSDDDGIGRDKWYMVVSNHQSWTDILVLQTTLVDRIPMLKFFTKRQLMWVPFVGQAMWFLDFPYVRRFSREAIEANPALLDLDRQATLVACEKFRNHPVSALNFLEGTRFTPDKHHAQDEPRFQRLLNPKTGGLSLVLGELSDRIDKLVDVTIDYPDGVPTIWEFMQGRCGRIIMRVTFRDIPPAVLAAPDDQARREATNEWIESIWREKDIVLTREPLTGLAN